MFGGRVNCPICGHSFLSDAGEGARYVGTSPAGVFRAEHDRENHPDYLAWKRSNRKLWFILGIAVGSVFDILIAYSLFSLGVQLPHGRAGSWPFLLGLFAGLPLPWLVLNRLGVRRFRREWNTRGGFPSPQGIRSD